MTENVLRQFAKDEDAPAIQAGASSIC